MTKREWYIWVTAKDNTRNKTGHPEYYQGRYLYIEDVEIKEFFEKIAKEVDDFSVNREPPWQKEEETT